MSSSHHTILTALALLVALMLSACEGDHPPTVAFTSRVDSTTFAHTDPIPLIAIATDKEGLDRLVAEVIQESNDSLLYHEEFSTWGSTHFQLGETYDPSGISMEVIQVRLEVTDTDGNTAEALARALVI